MIETICSASSIPWEPAVGYPKGTEWKVLQREDNGEAKAILLKLFPGFAMTAHSHIYPEHHYVLRGEYESQGATFAEGCYQYIPRHRDHGPFLSPKGAELLVIWES